MGKATGFMEYERKTNLSADPLERIKNFDEFHPMLSQEERKKQGARCMDCGVPFCQSGINFGGSGFSGCPLHNLIPEWNDMTYIGNLEHALSRLLKTSSFPEFTGRVCPALCEAACTCGLNGESVTVRENELNIIETAFSKGWIQPRIPTSRTGKRIAVVGSGPSGLAAADLLNRRGHNVTVYEREDRPGGLLMYGIPNMKLEKRVVERRVALMESEGVEFITNANIGSDVPAERLTSDYDAVILCCGAKNPRDLKIPGRDAKGVYFAVDFLKSTTKSLMDTGLEDGTYISAKDKNVIVVGGGDTGNDCVGTSIRHGCASLLQIEMMPRLPDERAETNPWPQWPRVCKTDYGQQEAIAVFGADPRIYQTTVKSLVKDESGNLKGAVLVSLEFHRDAESGRMVMSEVEGSEKSVDCELLLIAAGFLGSEEYLTAAFDAETDARSNVKTPSGSYKTSAEKVFAAGDVRRGQSLVVWAIAEGRSAAKEVDEYIMGYTGIQ